MTNASVAGGDIVFTDKVNGYLWITFAVCFLSNILAGIVSTIMAVYLPVIVKTLSLSTTNDSISTVSALISSLYILGWAVGGLTWGFITDKIGRSRSLVISVAGYGLFTALISFAASWEMIVALRLMAGFCVGGLMVITPTLLSEIWPASSRSIILGLDSIGFPIGIFTSGVVTWLVSDWHQAFMIGLIPLGLAALGIWLLTESPGWKSRRDLKTQTNSLTKEDKSNLLKGSVIFGSMLIGMWALFSWLPTWEQSILGSSDGQSERGITMMLLGGGGLTGGFCSGWVSNAIGVRKAMMICFAGCFVMSVIIFGLNSTFSPIIYAETTLLSLFFGMSQGLLSIYITQLFPTAIRATATGFCFNAGRFFTAGAVFFVGTLVALLGGYSHALLVFSLVFLAGFITLYFSTENAAGANAIGLQHEQITNE